jgi:hypothetical protein
LIDAITPIKPYILANIHLYFHHIYVYLVGPAKWRVVAAPAVVGEEAMAAGVRAIELG